MGRKALIERQKARALCIDRYSEKRQALKAILSDHEASPESRIAAQKAMQKLPRYSSPFSFKRLCKLTGRTRSVYRRFEMSRIELRRNALDGLIPGVRKSSW